MRISALRCGLAIAFSVPTACAAGFAHGSIRWSDHVVDVRVRPGRRLDDVSAGLRKDIGEFSGTFPAIAAREIPRLVAVEVDDGSPSVEPGRAAMKAVLASPAAELACPDGLPAALEQDFVRALAPVFRGRQPEAIQPAEAADYFDYVRLERGLGPGSDASIVAKVARFASGAGASDAALRARVSAWLIDEGQDLGRRGVCGQRVPPELQTERQAYVRWLGWVQSSLDAGDRLALGLVLFAAPPRPDSYGYSEPEACVPWHFDGFDVYAFGLANLDAWTAASAHDAHAARVLSWWVRDALATDAGAARLARDLGDRDEAFLRSFFSSLRIDSDAQGRLVRALQAYPRAQRIASERFTR